MTDLLAISGRDLAPADERAWWAEQADQVAGLAANLAEVIEEVAARQVEVDAHLTDLGLSPKEVAWVRDVMGVSDVFDSFRAVAEELRDLLGGESA